MAKRKAADNMVQCPLCSASFAAWSLNLHMDLCESKQLTKVKKVSRAESGASHSSSGKQARIVLSKVTPQPISTSSPPTSARPQPSAATALPLQLRAPPAQPPSGRFSIPNFVTLHEEAAILRALDVDSKSLWKETRYTGHTLERRFGIIMEHSGGYNRQGPDIPEAILEIVVAKLRAQPALRGWHPNNVSNSLRGSAESCVKLLYMFPALSHQHSFKRIIE
jgi:hypothetical protein